MPLSVYSLISLFINCFVKNVVGLLSLYHIYEYNSKGVLFWDFKLFWILRLIDKLQGIRKNDENNDNSVNSR